MYQPAAFANNDLSELQSAIRVRSFGSLVTAVPGKEDSADHTLQASHVPFIIDNTSTSDAPAGTLYFHLSASNPQCKRLVDQLNSVKSGGVSSLALFHLGDAYISPSWYPEKTAPGPQQGKVVPTWDFMVVQARGTVSLISTSQELEEKVLNPLTNHHEATAAAALHARPWKVSDAPRPYLDLQIASIVGFQFKITQLQGSWKLSQNKSKPTLESVAKSLRAVEKAAGISGQLQTAGGAGAVAAGIEAVIHRDADSKTIKKPLSSKL